MQWGSTGSGEDSGPHLALEVHVGDVAADGSISLMPAPILFSILEAALAQGALVASAPYLAHVDGPQA